MDFTSENIQARNKWQNIFLSAERKELSKAKFMSGENILQDDGKLR